MSLLGPADVVLAASGAADPGAAPRHGIGPWHRPRGNGVLIRDRVVNACDARCRCAGAMLRTPTLALLLLTCGCATTEPTVFDSQPAPMSETRIDPANGVTTQPARSSPAGMVFTPSDSIAHQWTDTRGRRMHVVFRVSLGMPADRTAAATERMQGNWATAARQARQVCERADLTTEPGTEQCEQQLCEVFTRALATDAPANDGCRASRVIWQRLTWD